MGKASGIIYNVVGGQNVGKSQKIIDLCKKSSRWTFVLDPRREYLKRFGKRDVTIFYDRKQFISKLSKFYNSNIIIEEATVFLKYQKEEEIVDLLTGAYHNGNIIYLAFHSLGDLPIYISRISHVLILFATGDDEILTQRNRPKLAKYLHKEATPKFIKLQPF